MNSSEARIIRLTETVSTNDAALRMAAAGEPLPLWVMAETQTGGRGRAGRAWQSPKGNLYASVAIETTVGRARAGELALVTGIALHDAITSALGLAKQDGLRLKWPNDLLIGRAKCGGILVESTAAQNAPALLAVAGIGLNLAARPDLPDDRPTASLAEIADRKSADDFIPYLTNSFDHWFAQWQHSASFAPELRTEWESRSGELGEVITINTGAETVSGHYAGLNDQGHLIVELDDASIRCVTHGDVKLAGELTKKETHGSG